MIGFSPQRRNMAKDKDDACEQTMLEDVRC